MNSNLGWYLSIKLYKAIWINKDIMGPFVSANPGKSTITKLEDMSYAILGINVCD